VSLANAVRGQRVVAALRAGGFVTRERVQLLRAEDDSVDVWNIVLAPATRAATGATIEGQPARFASWVPGDSGAWEVTMTWGGGGVSFRTAFRYPANGGTFAVAGHNVMIEVRPLAAFNVFTPETAPSVEGWVMPSARPTSFQPLVDWQPTPGGLAGGAFAIDPWCRAIHVGADTAAANVTVVFDPLAITIVVPAGAGPARIPVPTSAERVTVTASAGLASIGQELAFT